MIFAKSNNSLCFQFSKYLLVQKQWRLPLRSNVQSSWLQIQRFRVRFSVLPGFLRSSGPGTGFTEPCQDKEELSENKYRLRSRKPRLTAVGIDSSDHATTSISKNRHYFADCCGRSVGIFRLQAKSHGVF
jgi:hypothetical protein